MLCGPINRIHVSKSIANLDPNLNPNLNLPTEKIGQKSAKNVNVCVIVSSNELPGGY